MKRILVAISLAAAVLPLAAAERIGIARTDLTPDYPIRLSGYGNRRTESEGVAQKLWAKALAIETEKGKPALLITVDNCGVPAWIREELAKRLKKSSQFDPDRLAICSSHTHSAPCLTGILPNLFSQDIIPSEQATIDRYSKELLDKLEKLATTALEDLKPAKLAWGSGQVDFARNRRTQGG